MDLVSAADTQEHVQYATNSADVLNTVAWDLLVVAGRHLLEFDLLRNEQFVPGFASRAATGRWLT